MSLPTVYFFCCNESGNLQEDVIALAEGFKEIGVPYFSNCNYWLQSPSQDDYLFRSSPEVNPEDCDIVVVSYTWPVWVSMGDFTRRQQPLPEIIFRKNRRFSTVFMDNHDGYRTVSWEPEFRYFDFILRTKFNPRVWHPGNCQPWAYGLTKRVIEATEGGLPFSERTRALLVNYGASHPFRYGARELAKKILQPLAEKVIPIDRTTDDLTIHPNDEFGRLMWEQTGGRYCRPYYERLKSTQMISCFCGDVLPPAPQRPDSYLVGGRRAAALRLFYESLARFDKRAWRAVGCDSFRFWEGMGAGCAVVNLDLEHYGVEMPVMPDAGVHYIGVKLHEIQEALEILSSESHAVEAIAKAGHAWAKTHYSPSAVAARFLKLFSNS